MKRIKVIKPFNKRVKGDVFEAKDEKAEFWVDAGMASYVKVTEAYERKIVEAEVKK